MNGAIPLPQQGSIPLNAKLPLTLRSSMPHPLRLNTAEADARIEKAAKDFEAVFLTEMLQPMFESVEQDEMFGGGYAEDVYRSMLTDEYGKLLARSGRIGIADHVKRELVELQEGE